MQGACSAAAAAPAAAMEGCNDTAAGDAGDACTVASSCSSSPRAASPTTTGSSTVSWRFPRESSAVQAGMEISAAQ